MKNKLIIISCIVIILILSFSLVVQADEIYNAPSDVNFSINSIQRHANDGITHIYFIGDDGFSSISLYFVDLLRIQQYIEMRNLNIDEFPSTSDDYILYIFENVSLCPPDLTGTYTNSGIVIPILRKALEKSNNCSDDELQQSYDELQQSYYTLQQNYITLLSENTSLKNQLMSLNEGYSILSDNYNRLLDEKETLQENHDELQQKYSSLFQGYNTLVDENATISEELDFYESEYHRLLEADIQAQKDIEVLLRSNNLLSSEIEALKTNNSALYEKGYNDAQKNSQALESGLITIFSAPMYIFGQVFNYEILGVNILSLIQVILTLCIVVFVVKKMR